MTITFPLPKLKPIISQANTTSYSTAHDDHPILEKLSSLLPRLSEDELAALSIAALHEGYEPRAVDVNVVCGSITFEQCIDLIQDLSQAGKVALVRSIAELLAVAHIAPDVALPILPPVPPAHPEITWCILSIDQAIAFAKAGRMDPAILAWGFPQQSYSVIPSQMLAEANRNLPGLREILNPILSERGQ